MLEFFRGWKRKVGCVTLAVACALMAGWLRSRTTRDAYQFMSDGWSETLASDSLGLSWTRNPLIHTLNQPAIQRSSKQTPGLPAKYRISPDTPFGNLMMNGWDTRWRMDLAGFHFGEMSLTPTTHVIHDTDRNNRLSRVIDAEKTPVRLLFWIIPYWSLVFPFTGISAWLLLSKPRARISPPITPATENA